MTPLSIYGKVYAGGATSGGQYNPAVTLGVLTRRWLAIKKDDRASLSLISLPPPTPVGLLASLRHLLPNTDASTPLAVQLFGRRKALGFILVQCLAGGQHAVVRTVVCRIGAVKVVCSSKVWWCAVT